MHLEHEDRYFILYGDLEVVLYDDRADSPTRSLVSKLYLSEQHRRLMNIPAGIWHANRNVGNRDVTCPNVRMYCVLSNSPTISLLTTPCSFTSSRWLNNAEHAASTIHPPSTRTCRRTARPSCLPSQWRSGRSSPGRPPVSRCRVPVCMRSQASPGLAMGPRSKSALAPGSRSSG